MGSSGLSSIHIFSGLMAHPIVLPASFPVSEYLAEFQNPGTIVLRTYRPEGWETHTYDLIQQGPVRMAVNAGIVLMQPPGVFHAPETVTLDLDDPGAEVSLLRHLSTGDLEIIGADDLSYECVGGNPHTELHRFILSSCPVELRIDIAGGARMLHITFDNPLGNPISGYTRLSAVQ